LPRLRSPAAVLTALLVLFPAARTTAPAVEPPTPQCAPDNGGITLPAGFCAVTVAEKLGQPRHIVVMPNGDLFVSANRAGVIALRDTTGDGRADVVQDWATGYGSSEVRYWNGHLYTETGTAILRYPLEENSLIASGEPDTVVAGLPAGGHGAKTFVIGDDGALYVNIGARTNSCQQPDRTPEVAGADPCVERESRAGVWAFRADRTGQKPADGVHFGIGIRNAVAMAINPSDKSLFVMQHGRDGLAQQWSKIFDEAKSGAFVAFHGSWNRAPVPQAGYNVVFQPMDRAKAAGGNEAFADGFRPSVPAAGAASHRPTGLAVGPDGSLYVADDQGGTIYRIMFTGR
jgi:glucose/arabinose dehydrogenase